MGSPGNRIQAEKRDPTRESQIIAESLFLDVHGVLLLTDDVTTFEMLSAMTQYREVHNNSPYLQLILGPGFQDKPEYNQVKDTIKGSLFLKPTAANLSSFKNYFLG